MVSGDGQLNHDGPRYSEPRLEGSGCHWSSKALRCARIFASRLPAYADEARYPRALRRPACRCPLRRRARDGRIGKGPDSTGQTRQTERPGRAPDLQQREDRCKIGKARKGLTIRRSWVRALTAPLGPVKDRSALRECECEGRHFRWCPRFRCGGAAGSPRWPTPPAGLSDSASYPAGFVAASSPAFTDRRAKAGKPCGRSRVGPCGSGGPWWTWRRFGTRRPGPCSSHRPIQCPFRRQRLPTLRRQRSPRSGARRLGNLVSVARAAG